MNPDASLFVAEPDSAGRARHDCADREGSLGNVARMRAVCCIGSPWRSLAHSRCCRDRSTSRSAPGCGSTHKDTDARLHLPVCLRHTDVDESPHRCDTAPACVPRHGVGHGADTNFQVVGRRRACLQRRQTLNSFSYLRIFVRCITAHVRARLLNESRFRATARALPCSRQSRWASRHNSRRRLLKERLIALLPPRSEAAQRRRSPRSIKRNTNQVPCRTPAPCSEAQRESWMPERGVADRYVTIDPPGCAHRVMVGANYPPVGKANDIGS